MPKLLCRSLFVILLLANGTIFAEEPIYKNFEKELPKRHGYLLVDTEVERLVSAWELNSDRVAPVRPPIGRRLMLKALRPGEYAWESISIPHFNLPHKLKLEQSRWRFTIRSGVINYAGTLFVGERRGRKTLDVRMINRSTEVWALLNTQHPKVLKKYGFEYNGEYPDHFVDEYLTLSNDGGGP